MHIGVRTHPARSPGRTLRWLHPDSRLGRCRARPVEPMTGMPGGRLGALGHPRSRCSSLWITMGGSRLPLPYLGAVGSAPAVVGLMSGAAAWVVRTGYDRVNVAWTLPKSGLLPPLGLTTSKSCASSKQRRLGSCPSTSATPGTPARYARLSTWGSPMEPDWWMSKRLRRPVTSSIPREGSFRATL